MTRGRCRHDSAPLLRGRHDSGRNGARIAQPPSNPLAKIASPLALVRADIAPLLRDMGRAIGPPWQAAHKLAAAAAIAAIG